jgi:hypothetical protein
MDGKSVKLELRVWYDPESRHIKLAGPGLTASTVSNDPGSKRYHLAEGYDQAEGGKDKPLPSWEARRQGTGGEDEP